MTTIADVQRTIGELTREVDSLRAESTANVGLLATAIRRSRLGLAEAEQASSMRRIAGPVGLIGWDPRQGAFGQADLATSLIDRLRAGGAASGATGAAALQDTLTLLEITKAVAAFVATAIQPPQITMGNGTAARDTRIQRSGAKTLLVDDNAGGPAKVHLLGDLVAALGASFAIVYNGDGTVATVTRSGAAGAATTTVTYSGSQITSVVTVRGGKTVTLTPTYTGADITTLARAVA